ncbi:hypothetical protein STCU_07954 [Strigomonas culicis]|uniref:Uncharacterized protein n=1 Tax=Strigomonas culicis TaxID=28005 RepID=S9U2G8_9TRYP|nr:hypothetical protein STCU_08497 [Strigomonas culicis]EPY23004.1 hypothetical protein STCU_07954 [Strigomonas culicis]|eukprot:EPY21769.1 hypothetical protein STCU_08497 [Strigomonas culicis]
MLKITKAHFKSQTSSLELIKEEVQNASEVHDARTLIPLLQYGIRYLSQHYPPVKNESDLENLPTMLVRGNEVGFSPLFDPALVDACCKRGIFPLALEIGDDCFVFGPKIHRHRSICALVDSEKEKQLIKDFPRGSDGDGVFDVRKLEVSKKMCRPPNEANKTACFSVFINRKEDLSAVFALVKDQHGESWMCKALRRCLVYMFFHPEKYTTKVIITAIRRTKYDHESERKDGVINEGDLIAGEIGFIVGDIYCSATGAYCMSGAGTLQLAVTGLIMKAVGCKIWDLGMQMKYKEDRIGCVELRREKWLQMASNHCANTCFTTESKEKYSRGVPVHSVFQQ